MRYFIYTLIILSLLADPVACCQGKGLPDTALLPAAYYDAEYLPLLRNKRVALVINQTSLVGKESLLDIMLARKIAVKKIFTPEHGFRGNEDAGAHVASSKDAATGLPVISLYGSNKKPSPEQLEDIDVIVYDLQDVGVRFYTYISTLQYCMEACEQAGKQLIILDRPNPNGFYVAGPVLEKSHSSFVGMQPIPVVYGMTAGEYALMLKGENWIERGDRLDLKVLKCHNYSHSKRYQLPVAPSPNLRTMEAVYAYPSLCLFEGTVISVGRGTDKPFMQYGCPEFKDSYKHKFTPKSGPGAKTPPFEGKTCYGELVAGTENQILYSVNKELHIEWLVAAYRKYPAKEKFFTKYFTSLTGNTSLQAQVTDGKMANEIRRSWDNDIKAFKKIRSKYLLYPDFE